MNMKRRLAFCLLLAMASITFPTGVAAQTIPPWHRPLEPAREVVEIEVGDVTLETELSVTGPQQTLGLGYRNVMPDDHAMLFVNDTPAPRTFWMKGMRFCLDIVWIEGGEIVGAAENVCPDPPGTTDANRARFQSPEPVTYVLEVNAGWLDEHGYGEGTSVTIPTLPNG